MATMRIETFWHASAGYGIGEGEPTQSSPCTYANGGGWASLKEMQDELVRRNKHRNAERIPNGVRMEGDCRTFQVITWEE